MTKSQKYFADFYRIWGVGKTTAEKLKFWEKRIPRKDITISGAQTAEDIIGAYEMVHAANVLPCVNVDVDAPGVEWPIAHDIFIEKWYWDHGVVSDQDGRLRFFRSTRQEVLEFNNLSDMSPEQELNWWEEFEAINGNEKVIDPNFEPM